MHIRILKAVLLAALVGACTVQVGGSDDQKSINAGTEEQQKELRDATKAVANLFDEGRYSESWTLVGPVLKSQTNQETWARHIATLRSPLGQAGKRVIKGFGFSAEIDGAPPGEYGIIGVETDFANAKGVEEKFVFERSAGEWKLVGYWLSKKFTIGARDAPNRSFKPNPPRYTMDPDGSALSSTSDTTRGGSA